MIAKDNENANARPSRISTRAKPVTLVPATTATGGTTRATAGTAASRAKTIGGSALDTTAGKRKREALGEVTGLVTNNKPAGKGKEKEDLKKEKFDGVVIKSKPVSTRQPLKPVTTIRQMAKAATTIVKKTMLGDVRESQVISVTEDNAMLIDPPAPAQTLPSITVRKATISQENVAAATRRSEAHRRTSSRPHMIQRQVIEDAEAGRVFKKRRTSSEAPEEDPVAAEEALRVSQEEAAAARLAAEIEAFAEEEEADPENSPWDDLDADDADDPLMVSDYVIDIFNYLKQTEVLSFSYDAPMHILTAHLTAYHHAKPKLYGLSERACLEDAWHLDRLVNPSSRPFPSSSRNALPQRQYH